MARIWEDPFENLPKREIEMCNLESCDDSIWADNTSGWTDWSDLTDCDINEVKSRHRLCNFATGNCETFNCDPSNCDESKIDYRVKDAEECKMKSIPNTCSRIKMVTDYSHKCPHDDVIFNGYNDQDTHNGWPGCPDAPWWWKIRDFFRKVFKRNHMRIL